MDDPFLADAELIDLTVSYDGSWMKRGHNSSYGIGCVVDTVTGLVLDLTVLSSYCQACSYAKARFGGSDTAKFHVWFQSHKNDCNKNYTRAAGGMEVTAAEIMWGRSESKGFRYTTMVSDSDARTFRHLSDLKVYGEDVALAKEECINHVAKRIGTAIRKLSTQTKKTGVTLGGRGEGKLTNGAITKLSAYYGTAIRAHPNNVSDMQDAVLATFYHVSSTDGKPKHDLRPKGKESWCFYQRALAEGKDPGYQCSNVSLYIIVFYVADCPGTMFKYTSHTNRAATKRCIIDASYLCQNNLCINPSHINVELLWLKNSRQQYRRKGICHGHSSYPRCRPAICWLCQPCQRHHSGISRWSAGKAGAAGAREGGYKALHTRVAGCGQISPPAHQSPSLVYPCNLLLFSLHVSNNLTNFFCTLTSKMTCVDWIYYQPTGQVYNILQ